VAKDRLIRLGLGGGVLIAGAAIEVAAGGSTALSLVDWIVGAVLTAVALRNPARRVDRLCLLVAVMWYLATAVDISARGWPAVADVLVLGYRGPLLHRLVQPTIAGKRRGAVLVPIAYTGPVLAVAWSGMATAAAAGILAILVAQSAGTRGSEHRGRTDAGAVAVLTGLGITWGAVSFGWPTGTAAIVVSDFAVVMAAWQISRSERDNRTTGTVVGMVIELSQSARPSAPLSASLAEVLADPNLQIAMRERDAEWRDEFGQPIQIPLIDRQTGRVTIVPVPGGGQLALLHGPAGTGDSDLSQAAARAAALLVESVRLTSEVRRQSEDVENSSARLVTIDEQERHALAERLMTGPMQRLAHASALLSLSDTGEAPDQQVLLRLNQLSEDLNRLAHGLYPQAVINGALSEALRTIVADAGVPTTLCLGGPLDGVNEQTAALVYFFIAECMTNMTRHAAATSAIVTVTLDRTLRIEVTDNGRGGAAPTSGRGLKGLCDRVVLVGGTFGVDSPLGGPTKIWAEMRQPE
jgi:signal transduction histidine kinase